MLRTTERSTYRGCRQQWVWHYLQRWETTRKRPALDFGTLAHEALAAFYQPGRKRGPHPAETFGKLWDNSPISDQYDDDGERLESRDLGIAMMEGYVDLYGTKEPIEIIAPEMTFQIDIHDEKGRYLCTFVGSFDAVFRDLDTGHLGMLEHKTGKRIEQVSVNSKYGEQGISYAWASMVWLRHHGLLQPTEVLRQVRFNWLRKAMPDTRPENEQGLKLNLPSKDILVAQCDLQGLNSKGTKDVLIQRLEDEGIDTDQLGDVSSKQPAPLYARQDLVFGEMELANWLKRIRAEAWEMKQVRLGRIPVYKNPGESCKFCAFTDVCEIHEMGGDWEDVLRLEFTKWSPYEDHERAMEANSDTTN